MSDERHTNTQTRTRVMIRCDECNTPVAEVRDGVLIIRSRHLGSKHVTAITLDRLRELLDDCQG